MRLNFAECHPLERNKKACQAIKDENIINI